MLHGLNIVATPIGNMQDITARALSTLQEVDLIYAEDTRVIRKILDLHGIKKTVKSLYERSAEKIYHQVVELLKEGKNIAYVSDAGTPGISDPGNRLVALVRKNAPSVTISPIPGASALTAALSVCGYPTNEVLFLHFPPHKKGRAAFFQRVAAAHETVVFFESVHRIEKAITALKEFADGKRGICVCRELTKMHEEITSTTIGEFDTGSLTKKGEFAIVLAPASYAV